MNDSATARIRIDAEVSSAVRGLQQVSKQLDSLVPGGKTVSQVLQRVQFGLLQIVQGTARNAFVNVTSGLKGMVDAGMQVAETLEAAAVGFETILKPGENVNALLLDIQKNAVKTPFDVDDLTASTQKLALITKNGAAAEQTILDLGAAVAAAGRGNAELNRMAINMQQIGLNSQVTARDLREFGNAGVDIIGLVAEYSKAFKETGKEASEAMDWLKTVSNPYEVIADVLHKAATENGRFADIYEKGATTIKQANENMQDSMAMFSYRVLEQSTILDKAKNVFSEFQNSLFLDETFTANTAAAIKHVIDMINELDVIRPIIEGIKKAVSAFANGQFDNVIVFFRELFNAIKQFSGIKVIINLFQVFLDLFSNNHTAEEVGHVAQQIGNLVRAFLELKFVLGVANYIVNFGSVLIGLAKNFYDLVPAIKSVFTAFNGIAGLSPKVLILVAAVTAAVFVFKNFGKEIAEAFHGIVSFVGEAVGAIAQGVKNFVTIGFNIMAGLWNGIVEGAKAVIEGVKNIARSITNAFKSALGIHSPSVVMRDTIGKNIMLGIAEGISKNYKGVESATTEVLEELVSLQSQYVKELSDFGALDLVQTMQVYKQFAALYKQGTKARLEMDQKVHGAEVAIIKEMISLIETYNKQWDKSFQKAKDYYDMFEYTQTTLTRSTKSVIEGLTRQNNNLTKYYDNLKKMSTMGFDDDFMQYIYDQGMDAAAEVNGLANATQEEIEKINTLWATRGKVAADIATLNTKKLKDETLDQLDELNAGLDHKMLDYYEDGAKIGYNFNEGLLAMMPTIEDAMNQVKAKTKEKTAEIGDVATDYAGLMNSALAGIDTSTPQTQLEDLNIKMFDTHDALSLLKNAIAGIPWYIWAAGIGVVVLKLSGLIRAAFGSSQKIKEVAKDASIAATSFDNLANVIWKSANNIAKSNYAVSDYASVFRQAMSGLYPTVNAEMKKIINLIDLAKSQGVIKTTEATKLIGDILVNGFDNISDESQKVVNKVRKAYGGSATAMAQDVSVVVKQTEVGINKSIKKIETETGNSAKRLATGVKTTVNDVFRQIPATFNKIPSSAQKASAEATKQVSKELKKVVKETELTADKIEKSFGKAKNNTVNIAGQMATEFVSPYSKIEQETDRMTQGLGKKFTVLGGKLRNGVSGISTALGTLGPMLSDINPRLAVALTNIGDTMSSGLFKVESLGITQIGGFVEKAKGAFSKFGPAAKTGLSSIKDGAKTAFDGTAAIIKAGTDQMKTGVKKGIDGTKSVATKSLGKMGKAITSKTKSVFGGISSAIVGFVKGIGDTISGVVNAIVGMIGDIIGGLVDTIMGLIQKLTGGIGKAIAALLKPLSDPKLLIGVGALAGVAFVMVLVAEACKTFNEVSWESMAKAGVAIVALGIIAGVLGAFAEPIAIGAGVLALAGLSLIVAGAGVLVFAKAIDEVSQVGGRINLDNIRKMVEAIAIMGAGLAQSVLDNFLGMFSGLFAMAEAGEMLVVALAFEEMSKHCGNIDYDAIRNLVAVVNILGSELAGNLIDNMLGAISGLFGMVTSGELLTIATGLEEASKHCDGINVDALKKVVESVGVLSSGLAGDLISNVIGAISGFAATFTSGELALIIKGLASASRDAEDIDVEKLKNVSAAVKILAHIDFGGFLSNIGKTFSGGALTGVVAATAEIVKGVKDICLNLKEVEDVDETSVDEQMKTVKKIVESIEDMVNGDWMKAIGQNWQSGNLEEVAKNVNDMIRIVTDICKSLQELDKVKALTDVVDENNGALAIVRKIVTAIDGFFSGDWLGGIGKNWQSGNLKEVAKNSQEIIQSVIDIADGINKLGTKVPEGQTVEEIINGKVRPILTAVDKLLEGKDANGQDWTGNLFNGSVDRAKRLAEVAQAVAEVVKNVEQMVMNLNNLKASPQEVTGKIGDIQTILQKLAQISLGDNADENSLEVLKANVGRINEYSKNFNDILGSVTGMIDKLAALEGRGYNVATVQTYVQNVGKIVQELANINIAEKDGNNPIADVAKKAQDLQGAASSYDSILGSVEGMIDKLSAFTNKGYNVGKGDSNDVLKKIENVEQIVQAMLKINLDAKDVQGVKDMGQKVADLKVMAENLDAIIQTVTKMLENLNTFSEKYKDTSVQAQVEKINNEILKPLLGDGADQSGIVFPEGISNITGDTVTQLDLANQCLKKIAEISGTLQTVQDASATVLNAETIVTFIKDTLAQLPGALATYTNDLNLQGSAYADAFLNGWRGKFGEATTVAHEMQGTMWSALESKMQDEYWQGAALGGKVVDGLREKVPEFGTVALEQQQKYWDAVESKMNDAKLQGEKLGKQVLEGLKSTTASFTEAGKEAQGKFWDAIESKMQDEYYQGAALAGKVVDGINSKTSTKDANSDIGKAGANVAIGFSLGLNSEMGRVSAAAGNISGTAIAKMKDLLGIASPSKVAMELGGYVTEGFADGITDGLNDVESAGEQLAEAIMSGYKETMEPLAISTFEARSATVSAQGVGTGAMAGGNTTTVNQYNNIYNDVDTNKALSDIAWAVSRS